MLAVSEFCTTPVFSPTCITSKTNNKRSNILLPKPFRPCNQHCLGTTVHWVTQSTEWHSPLRHHPLSDTVHWDTIHWVMQSTELHRPLSDTVHWHCPLSWATVRWVTQSAECHSPQSATVCWLTVHWQLQPTGCHCPLSATVHLHPSTAQSENLYLKTIWNKIQDTEKVKKQNKCY